jgi:hypothetical protein
MDLDTAILLRYIERLAGVFIGGLAIYLGYRLFLKVPERREGEGRIKLLDASIVLSRIGPGVFFALFGAAVVALSLYKGVLVETADGRVQGSVARSDAAPSQRTERFSGMGAYDDAGEAERRADARALLRRDIAVLNNFLPKLRADLPPQDRTEVELALPRIKFALMQPVWPQNETGWGDPARFEAWLSEGERDPPPAEIAAAVDYFRYGTAGAGP